jgi:site-specific DNA recombinase
MKRAIRYLRFSQLGQSNGSIERQDLYTTQWLEYNKVELVDTFIDRGKSARTFDRPDFNKLQQFITKYHKNVDYLLVDQMDRFSRDAGEAMSLVKSLQRRYGIQIVSVTENITFDYDTPGSFFRAGLQLLLAEEDNINRSIKIRGGNYTARAKEGRFLSNLAPFGYKKEGVGKDRTIVIEEREALVVRYIFDAFLNSTPLYIIKQTAREMGFNRGGSMAIERVLQNPAYAGMVHAKAFKDHPGGLFPARHEPLIDKITWRLVQSKMKKPETQRRVLDDNIPLRGILRCHCGAAMTGAPSRGRHGGWYYYYKCSSKCHNNISAKKAHQQFLDACDLMSLTEREVKTIKEKTIKGIERYQAEGQKMLTEKKSQLDRFQEKLFAVEEKYINDQITKDTYDRWCSNYVVEIDTLKKDIARLGKQETHLFSILDKHISLITDIRGMYESADTICKQEFVKLGFDNNLYYENGIYRTPTMLDCLSRNYLKMKDKGLLVFDKKRDFQSEIPSGGAGGIRTLVQTWYKVSFLHA